MGWVSLFDVDALRALLRMPDGAKPIAVLCVGHVDAFYAKPMLEQERWAARMPIDACLFENGWDDPAAIDAAGSPSSPVDAADAATETGAGSASASTTSVGGSPNASPDGAVIVPALQFHRRKGRRIPHCERHAGYPVARRQQPFWPQA